MWLYDSIDLKEMTGSCERKLNTSLKCSDFLREEQCDGVLSETLLNSKCVFNKGTCIPICESRDKEGCDVRDDCSWIYSYADEENEAGNCFSKNSTRNCEEIKRISQCEFGEGISSISGICVMYENLCRTRCSELKNCDSVNYCFSSGTSCYERVTECGDLTDYGDMCNDGRNKLGESMLCYMK
jgi:hypothetical protein